MPPASHPWTRAARRRAEEAQQQVEQGQGATEVTVTNNNEGGEESEPIREMETAGGLEDDEEDLQTVSRATMDGSTSESMAMKIPSDLVEKRVTTSDRLQHQATDIGLMPRRQQVNRHRLRRVRRGGEECQCDKFKADVEIKDVLDPYWAMTVSGRRHREWGRRCQYSDGSYEEPELPHNDENLHYS
ncbi:hypothetical protein GN244_ATG08894 [Phytophthora infestans]|nr:hypothetical protein GN244_ATG08894 [Phytophthora infestans]